jgi:hypothetical protein
MVVHLLDRRRTIEDPSSVEIWLFGLIDPEAQKN